jgi:hypothetical protein
MRQRFLSLAMLAVGLTIGLLVGRGTGVRAQPAALDSLPLSGSVVDSQGQPVRGLHISLIRRSGQALNRGGGNRFLASDQTDGLGQFNFDVVDIKNEIDFPLETSASLEYVVFADSAEQKRGTPAQTREITKIDFTAPRLGPYIQSVSAVIHVK